MNHSVRPLGLVFSLGLVFPLGMFACLLLAEGARGEDPKVIDSKRLDDPYEGEARDFPLGDFRAKYSPEKSMVFRARVIKLADFYIDPDHSLILARVHLGGEFPDVVLPPREYLEKNGVLPEIGDYVRIRGNIFRDRDYYLIIADSLTVGEQTLRLRDDKGRPAWSHAPEVERSARNP